MRASLEPEEQTKYNEVLGGIKNYSQKMDEFLAQASTMSDEQMSTYLRDVNGPIALEVQRVISELIALNSRGSSEAVQWRPTNIMRHACSRGY
jgi:methyl-accepting chemotaxis protein